MCSMMAGFGDASTQELVESIQAAATELASRAAPSSGTPSGTQAMRWAESLGRSIDLAEAALAVLVGLVDACGAHQESGFPSAVAWLRERLGMRHGRAAERVMLARQLPRLARVAKLLATGGLSAGFAAAICAAVPRLGDADAAAAEDILLGMAEDGCTVAQVGKAADRITDLIRRRQGKDPEPEDSRRGFTRSWLQRSRSLDGGSWLKGWLTPEHTAAFEQIIGPLAKPRAHGDDRDLGQRTADALMSVITGGNKGAGITIIIDLAAYTAATGDTGPLRYTRRTTTNDSDSTDHTDTDGAGDSDGTDGSGGINGTGGTDDSGGAGVTGDGTAPAPARHNTLNDRNDLDHLDDLDDLDDLDGLDGLDGLSRGQARSKTPIRDPGQDEPGSHHRRADRGRVAARLLDGTQISAADARRIALNAGINALILGTDGLPLYLGRTVRFVTPAQRKALLAMYDTCAVKGCQIPAHLSEIHHLNGGWKLGTPTDINRLVPACGWHNRWFEQHPDRVTQTRDSRGRVALTIHPPSNTQPTTPTKPQQTDNTEHGKQPGAP